MKLLKAGIILLVVLIVASCGKSKYEKMSNAELTKKERHCDSIPKKSAVFANGCEKIAKEVIRRRKEK